MNTIQTGPLPVAAPVFSTRQPLKLLFVINAPIFGGAERHTFDLAAGLEARDCRSTIFAIKPGPLAPSGSVTLLQPQGPRSLMRRILDLGDVIGRETPDVLVSVNERPVLVASIGRLVARATMPFIGILHSTVLNNRREELMQLAYNPLFERARGVVFVSDNQRAYWMRHGLSPRRGITILNGVDITRFSPHARNEFREPMRRSLDLGDDDVVLGLCAVMRPEKNHLQLLDALASLRQQGVPAKALLVGDGPMRGAIEQRIDALGLRQAVVLTGMHDDVRPYVAAFDIGVLCSVSIETLSLAAIEIMAMGVPMVMSDLSGASEIIDGTNGRLFPIGDLAGLASALASLIDPEVRHEAGLSARRRAEQRFDRQTMLDAYSAYLAEQRRPVRDLTVR